jgi:hypothetical protein
MKHLRPLITNGTIKTFNDLLYHVTKKELMQAMGCSLNHLNHVLRNPEKVTLRDVANLSEAVGVKGWEAVGKLFIFD